jgi:hypothetical protein
VHLRPLRWRASESSGLQMVSAARARGGTITDASMHTTGRRFVWRQKILIILTLNPRTLNTLPNGRHHTSASEAHHTGDRGIDVMQYLVADVLRGTATKQQST